MKSTALRLILIRKESNFGLYFETFCVLCILHVMLNSKYYGEKSGFLCGVSGK